ncbi:MAG: TetR/AcrR family transcriptional regulator [Actinomycetota bacterium]|nr:TetR/AcrR family transcriptional regulator [Actinomycetota bacterium]
MVRQSAAPIADDSARERVLAAAYDLFARRGIRDVGVDEIVTEAGIARATLYRHFKSKDALVLAFLERREQRWTFGSIEAEARRRGETPDDRLLAIFDVFDEWFQRADFEACSFVNVLFEMRSTHPLGQASIQHLRNIRGMVERLAAEAGIDDPAEFARSWHILMKGSIVAATEGDLLAAKRAQKMARTLIASHQS